MESEAENDEFNNESQENLAEGDERPVFELGKTVILMNQDPDIYDSQAVLINPVDSYVGKYLGQYLSTKSVGATLRGSNEETDDDDDEFGGEEDEDDSVAYGRPGKTSRYWKILGTLNKRGSFTIPFLWAMVKQEDYDAYLREAVKCRVIIYDLSECSPERLEEVRAICDALKARVEKFNVPRIFILISSLHTWSHTKPRPDEEPYSESDYRRRHTKPLYRDLQLLERYVVASGKMTKGKLKAYVIGCGAIYGDEEGPLHHWFMSAWHNAKYLPIYGSGKNYLPTVYIQDVAKIVQNVVDAPPKLQRYLIAADPVLCQQDQIAKAISRQLGSGRVKRLPEEDIFLNKGITTFQADQHLLNFKIQSGFAMENFNMEFTAEEGMDNIIKRICTEYKQSRNLEPLKVCIVGPPASGKSLIARQISDLYRLNHFTKEDLLATTLDLLKETAGESVTQDIQGLDADLEDHVKKEARDILAEVDEFYASLPTSTAVEDPIPSENEEEQSEPSVVSGYMGVPQHVEPPSRDLSKLSDQLFVRVARWRLLSNQCQNQGFLLDGFPESLEQAKSLFEVLDDEILEESGEDFQEGREPVDKRIMPDKVIVLEASDEFLTTRLQSMPSSQLQEKHKDKNFQKALADYRELNSVYESSFLYYLDLQEVLYAPMDVTTGDGLLVQNIIGKIMDMLGKPRNYGLSQEEENALKNSSTLEKSTVEQAAKEDMAVIESRELEERRAHIQQWMEKLAKVKREEFEREEAALVPLRHYLMAHVVPTLTKGLIDVTRARPEDPVEYLAEYLFSNNPGSLNTTLGDNFPKK